MTETKTETKTATRAATKTATELPVANPRQFTEAWGSHVSGTNRPYVLGEWRDYGHCCKIPDPIYYRDLGGWHRASEIRNPAAIRAMRKGLQQAGVRASDEVEAAWKRNEDHAYAIARIRNTVNNVTGNASLETEPAALLDEVVAALEGLRPDEVVSQ